MTRDALLAIVGVALLAFVASGMVDKSVAPTLVLVAGGRGTAVAHETLAAWSFTIAALLFLNGYMLMPIANRLGVTFASRVSLALLFVSLGTWQAWLGTWFAQDLLHNPNYSWPIITIRVLVLSSLVGLSIQVYRRRREDANSRKETHVVS